MSRYKIDTRDIGILGDRPLWSIYGLETYGDIREELLQNVVVTETDQDGGDFDAEPLENHGDDVRLAVEKTIDAEIARIDRILTLAPEMLDLLKRMTRDCTDDKPESMDCEKIEALRLIAKAEGRS